MTWFHINNIESINLNLIKKIEFGFGNMYGFDKPANWIALNGNVDNHDIRWINLTEHGGLNTENSAKYNTAFWYLFNTQPSFSISNIIETAQRL